MDLVETASKWVVQIRSSLVHVARVLIDPDGLATEIASATPGKANDDLLTALFASAALTTTLLWISASLGVPVIEEPLFPPARLALAMAMILAAYAALHSVLIHFVARLFGARAPLHKTIFFVAFCNVFTLAMSVPVYPLRNIAEYPSSEWILGITVLGAIVVQLRAYVRGVQILYHREKKHSIAITAIALVVAGALGVLFERTTRDNKRVTDALKYAASPTRTEIDQIQACMSRDESERRDPCDVGAAEIKGMNYFCEECSLLIVLPGRCPAAERVPFILGLPGRISG